MNGYDFTLADHGTVATITAASEFAKNEFDAAIRPSLEGWQISGPHSFTTDHRAAQSCVWQLENAGFSVGPE